MSREFGEDAVLYVDSDTALAADALSRYRVILCPLTCLRAIEPLGADLIVNTGSLQEMPEDWVSYYMEWLDRQNARYFYSLNYFAQPVGFLAESVNLWSPRPSSKWIARTLRWNPAFIRMQADRNYLEALFERTAKSSCTETESQLSWLSERRMIGEASSSIWSYFVDL